MSEKRENTNDAKCAVGKRRDVPAWSKPPQPSATKDPRPPLARGRDEWFASVDGIRCMEPSILISPYHCQYLQNRLEMAFLAGAKWAGKEQ